MEGLIFGGAYLRREIYVSKSIGLTLSLQVNLPFLLCFTLYLRAIFRVQAPGGLIFGGANTRRGLFSEFYSILLLYLRFSLSLCVVCLLSYVTVSRPYRLSKLTLTGH